MLSIGFIGTGLMGVPMALRLIAEGFEVTAYNRTRSKLEPLERAGAQAADSVTDLVRQSDCMILMVTNAEAIAQLILTDEVKPLLANRLVIQMSTIAPDQSQGIGETVIQAGGEYLEAPVLGSIPQAKDGSLIVMVGGRPEVFEKASPVLKCFGPEPMLMGDVGTAAATKLAMNQLIGSLTTAFSLSLGLVQRAGIDVNQFMDIVRQSALYAPTFDKKLQRMCDRDFSNPNFPAKHLLKDMNLFADAATSAGLDPSLVKSVSQIAQKAVDQGWADADYSALYAAVNPES